MGIFGGMRERKQAKLHLLQTVKGLDVGSEGESRLSREGAMESKYHINSGGAKQREGEITL